MLQAMAWAMRTTISTVTHHSAGELAFSRDMMMSADLTIDWAKIAAVRKDASLKGVARENAKRVVHEYRTGDKVLILKDASERRSQRKIGGGATEGPYEILKVNRNSTVEILRNNYTETIDIRHIKPFKE